MNIASANAGEAVPNATKTESRKNTLKITR
jgi:hypothetical protein